MKKIKKIKIKVNGKITTIFDKFLLNFIFIYIPNYFCFIDFLKDLKFTVHFNFYFFYFFHRI